MDMSGKTTGRIEADLAGPAAKIGARVTVHESGDVTLWHAKDATPRDAHAAAKAIPGFAIRETFRDGWGRVVSLGTVEVAR
jgi:hypothetical protein